MAHYIGAVRFPDGDIKYFVYAGTTDRALRQLLHTAGDALAYWSTFPAPICVSSPTASHLDEPVEIMPYYGHGNNQVMFRSTANRQHMHITGPVSAAEAMQPTRTDTREFAARHCPKSTTSAIQE